MDVRTAAMASIGAARNACVKRFSRTTAVIVRPISSSASICQGVLAQLKRVSELQHRVGGTNSTTEKQGIIADYPDLRRLLEQVYHPKFRTHFSSSALESYLSSSNPLEPPNAPPADILDLFHQLSSRSATGNAAKELVRRFLISEGVISDEGGSLDEEALEVFKRLLDRNLVAGFGARTLSEVRWATTADATASEQSSTKRKDPDSSQAMDGRPEMSSTGDEAAASPAIVRSTMDPFSCALGKTILAEDLPSLFRPGEAEWWASRKVDGVRVVTLLDFHMPKDGSRRPKIVDIQHLSRAGNLFTSLGKLETTLRSLEGHPLISPWLLAESPISRDDSGRVVRLVLDGEVCVMQHRPPSESAATSKPVDILEPSRSTDDDDLIEDFPATVSQIKQKKHTISRPQYHLFDILPWSVFSGSSAFEGPERFSIRREMLRLMGSWLRNRQSLLEQKGSEKNGRLKVLDQVKMTHMEDVERMMQIAADRGWEGLVFRADRPYKGRRSSDIRKFKQWLDAEYTVRNIELSRQRLGINGVFAEHEAVAALVFHHKGHPVTVSSGLTAEQRIKWAEDPTLIIGKQITVEYFSESEAVGREGAKSLRFPRIKQIWDDERDI